MGADWSLPNVEQKWNEDTSIDTHLDRQKTCLMECCCGRLGGKKLSLCLWQGYNWEMYRSGWTP